MKRFLAPILLFLATPLLAAYASRDAVLPIAGRAAGADGRLYLTALWITNPSERDAANVTLTFHPVEEKQSAHQSTLQLKPGETRVLDPFDENGLGALRIESTKDVLATARVYSRMPNESGARSLATSFAATPVEYAIGNGESATLQGVSPADGRYKLFFAEVAGMPLEVSVSLLDSRGMRLAAKRIYIDKERQVTADTAELFPQFTGGTAVLRIDGVNGAGRIVVAGSHIARESQDSSPFEMSFSTTPRTRLGVWEAIAYVAVAAAAGAALVFRR